MVLYLRINFNNQALILGRHIHPGPQVSYRFLSGHQASIPEPDEEMKCPVRNFCWYNKSKAIVIGYSIGASASLMAAAKDNSPFGVIFAAG